MLGNEEDKIIKPVIKKLNHKNKMYMVHSQAIVILEINYIKNMMRLFHYIMTQGLISFKMISFSDGVTSISWIKIIITCRSWNLLCIFGKNQANNISLDKAILLNSKIISKNG